MPRFSSIPRVLRRRILRRIRRQTGSPDAWGDIIDFLNKHPRLIYVDIGAHIGRTVERVADECVNDIVAFEPTPQSRSKLQQRFSSHSRVIIDARAVSDHAGRLDLHLNSNEQTNSLLENAPGNLRSFPADVAHLSTTPVDTITLDEWRNTVASDRQMFLKLDVQGAELKVLRGAAETLGKTLGVYAECPLAPMYEDQGDFWQIHEFLSNEGFQLHEIYPCFKDPTGRACQTDALWLRLPDS
jgi:FkbM family methyltransferase